MSSAPIVPIRQPRGPSSNSFGSAAAAPGPPAADSDLKRHNTVSTPRHQPSASLSAFQPSRVTPGASRFRSGSLSSGTQDAGLVRRGSAREVRTEVAVPEGEAEEPAIETGSWGKGLGRQSSLPSRRVFNSVSSEMPPPPRPPRRVQANTPTSTHSASQSLSSLTMLHPTSPPPEEILSGANVSRTQSLRAQAKHTDNSGLGRSTSLKAVGEQHRPHAMSPSSHATSPHNPFTPPTPPLPVSSTAAFPPFQLTTGSGADIRRHQSLTQGYGSSSRVRDRLERSPAVPGQRPRGPSEEPPTSPIGPSVWSNAGPVRDDGWTRSASQQLQNAFDAMTLGRKMMGGDPGYLGEKIALENNVLRHPQTTTGHHEEPSWVTNLVGDAPRQQMDVQWHNRGQSASPRYPEQYQPWSQPQLTDFKPQTYQQFPGYLPAPYASAYPTPPGTAVPAPMLQAPMLAQDREVIELARKKGLNPATFNCRPSLARFFVIKSYTEDDVQKSLKHEIWSSTMLGNKRLDAAFRESSDKMPIYLFFSVNGSRHFCGVAEMLTPVDESQSSTVWAQDKWKGIFKVKWIFVRDVPSAALRHIRLMNTPERKPITNSRDTQEIHHEAGCEVLQIFLDHQNKSKTSLLQDFAYYERLSANRSTQGPPQGSLQPPFPPQLQPAPQFAQMMPPPMQAGASPVPSVPARFR